MPKDVYKKQRELIFLLQEYELNSKDLNLELLTRYLRKLVDLATFQHKHNINSNNKLITETRFEILDTQSRIKKIESHEVLLIFNNASKKGGRKNDHVLNYTVYKMSLLFRNKGKIEWAKLYEAICSHPTLRGFFEKKISSFKNEYHAKDTLRKKANAWELLKKSHERLKPKRK